MRGTDINLFCVVRNFIYLYICINFFWTRSVNVIELKDGFLNNWVFAEIIHVQSFIVKKYYKLSIAQKFFNSLNCLIGLTLSYCEIRKVFWKKRAGEISKTEKFIIKLIGATYLKSFVIRDAVEDFFRFKNFKCSFKIICRSIERFIIFICALPHINKPWSLIDQLLVFLLKDCPLSNSFILNRFTGIIIN